MTLTAAALDNIGNDAAARKAALNLLQGAIFRGRLIAQERLQQGADGLDTARLLAAVQDEVIHALYDFTVTHVHRASNPTEAAVRAVAKSEFRGRAGSTLVLRSLPGVSAQRVVLVGLGSPLAGSSAARGLARHHLGFWLGRSGTLLRSGLHLLPEGREVGVIAGSKPVGLGRYFGDFDGLNDGTVAVWETRLPGLADHRVLPDSHTGLLLDPRVGDLAAGFLRDGRFPA